jgi:hypothetical protein
MMWRSLMVGFALTAMGLASGCACWKGCSRPSCASPVVSAAPCCPAPPPAPCCNGPGAPAPVQSYSVPPPPAFSNGYAH